MLNLHAEHFLLCVDTANHSLSCLHSFMVNGRRGSSCHGCLEYCGLLTEEYHRTVQALKQKYYPLELDTSLTQEQRVAFMEEWVEQAHDALSQAGLTKATIEQAVREANIALRGAHAELFTELDARAIPLLVFSAGLADVLEEVIRQHASAPLPAGAHVISNRMSFEPANGGFIGFTGQLFHVFNKRAGAVLDEPYFMSEEVKLRRNVLLLGDSLGDLQMASGLEADEVLSVGFLNDQAEERIGSYLAGYDVVIIGPDAGLQYALDLVRELK
ncbi:5'-nucleotidase, cytosolic 3 [Tribonema minus]|uniref:5'-nucleotidase n=1 Tax=Tribonema minus TaxID=303371 RepID=A0A835YMP4_9STRA|nr:5'-nucleotidase, cytosolic 3 [Tribonema minus]